jgi:arsenite methyltransferase
MWGCMWGVSGASEVGQYENWLKEAGFDDAVILDTKNDLNIYKDGILSMPFEEGAAGGGPKREPVESSGRCFHCCLGRQPLILLAGCCGAPSTSCAPKKTDKGRVERLVKLDLNEYIGAYQIYAVIDHAETAIPRSRDLTPSHKKLHY